MNNLLIQKLIKTYNLTYPEITYSNPLLDKEVTKALSKSLVKLLITCKENDNMTHNVSFTVLENIRNLCRVQPENHMKTEDNTLELLLTFYEKHINEFTSFTKPEYYNVIDKKLETFLLKEYVNLDFNSSYNIKVNPEILQALINLNNERLGKSIIFLQTLLKDLIHWDNSLYSSILFKLLWNNCQSIDPVTLDNLSVKMKSEIENILLSLCSEVIDNTDVDISSKLSNKKYISLFKTCSISATCFQMCYSIFNYVFIVTNFNEHIGKLIYKFINIVKSNCTEFFFCHLYPNHLNSIITLLELDANELPSNIKELYVKSTIPLLRAIHNESKTDLILLLSHFPSWFDLYYSK